MHNPHTPLEAIREVLFRDVETINQRLMKKLADVADHVSRREDRAVIGALEGAEADIEMMQGMMLLARDCFAIPDEKGGTN